MFRLPDDGKTINVIYFFTSFIFLVGRTVAVTLFTARINDQSKVALPCLYNCASPTYTPEVNVKKNKFQAHAENYKSEWYSIIISVTTGLFTVKVFVCYSGSETSSSTHYRWSGLDRITIFFDYKELYACGTKRI